MKDNYIYKTEPSEVNDAYEIAADGGMIYNPLSREAIANGKTAKYEGAECESGSLKLASGEVVDFEIPKNITAYDMVPISYTLSGLGERPLHLEVAANEDAARKNGKGYYDCILPGYVKVDFEYLGHYTSTEQFSNRPIHTNDFSGDIKGKQYPQYNCSEFKEYSQVKMEDHVWFKFRYTNNGDTILDSNGGGTFNIEVFLDRKNEQGEYELYLIPHNMFYRTIDELYPGESNEVEMDFTFDLYKTGGRPILPKGDYQIRIITEVRNETSNPEEYVTNIWAGRHYGMSLYEFSVVDEVTDFSKNEVVNTEPMAPIRNTWLHSYEEFLTSFDSYLAPCKKDETKHTIYLQCAPWTEAVTVKFMSGNNDDLVTADIPVKVESDSIKIKLNTSAQNYIIKKDGTRYPALASQSMADMRVHSCMGHAADETLLNSLMDMKDCGINIVTTTESYEYNMYFQLRHSNQIDANWFLADALRRLDMYMEGYITYPYDDPTNIDKGRFITGDKKMYPDGYKMKSVADPVLAHANGAKALYQYRRWGDNYFVLGDGTVPLNTEDSRGWMRVDISNRYNLSEQDKLEFREYLAAKYETVEKLNEVWESDYKSFDEIDPMNGAADDHGNFSLAKADGEFKEWSIRTNELDVFRTRQRINNYKIVSSYTEPVVNAVMSVRTEGGNFTSSVPYNTPNQHYRHTYYSQRRVGLVSKVLANESSVKIHSDYCTLPYLDSEVTELTENSMKLGIMPMHLPQFNRMRDIAVNEKYGTDYSKEYNLCGKNTKGAYLSTVRSVFCWYKATYEAGGIPGILWEDVLCDGFATSVQQKEIKFYSQKIAEAMNTPEGKTWANAETTNPADSVATSVGAYSYEPEYVDSLIAKVKLKRNS